MDVYRADSITTVALPMSAGRIVSPPQLLRSFRSLKASRSMWVSVGFGGSAVLRYHCISSQSVCPSFSFILLAVCSVLVIMSSTGTCLGAMANFRPKVRTCSCASVSCWLLRFTTSRLLSRVLICRCHLSCSRFSNFLCVCFTFSCSLLPCHLVQSSN